MTTIRRLDQHHAGSLGALEGEWNETFERWSGLLEEPFDAAFNAETDNGRVRIGQLDWKDPGWIGPPDELRWIRTLEFDVSVDRYEPRDVALDDAWPKVSLSLLWPLDSKGAAAGQRLRPGVRLGPGSLIDGRPLVPLRQRSYRPGLHIILSDSSAGKRRLVLVPDAGPSLLIHPQAKQRYRATILGRFLPTSDSRRPAATFEVSAEEDSSDQHDEDEEHDEEQRQDFLDHFRRLIGRDGPPTAYFSAETERQVEKILGKLPAESELNDYWRLVRPGRSGGGPLPDLSHELSDQVLATKDYGDLLADVVIESILAPVREFHELDQQILLPYKNQDPRLAKAVELAKRISRQFNRRYRHMRRGGEHAGTRYPALVVGVDDRNTLADLEQRRKVTRYSAEIGTDTNHWRWTRGIHGDDRNRLCPLQTPESEDIGYVRFLALGNQSKEAEEAGDQIPDDGVPDDMRDLSAAASLIPFVNHNDPARSSIGSKNLKQALAIEGASGPRVRSGTESLIAEAHGVARLEHDVDAVVTKALEDRVVARAGDEGGEEFCVLFGPPGPSSFWADGRWKRLVKEAGRLKEGDLIAHAPDVVIEDGDTPVLALGTDVLVAYTPWKGMNYEDAVVVSDSIVEDFTSTHILSINEQLRSRSELVHALVPEGKRVKEGEALALILSMEGERLRTVTAPEDGKVEFIDEQDCDGITIRLRTRRPLAVGDKLTNRHGGKCIVSQILPASDMPALPDGRKVEMLLNPIGVIRRLNVGQLLETHLSLLDYLVQKEQAQEEQQKEQPRVVGRRFGPEQRKELAAELSQKGAEGGRLKLKCADGTELDRYGGVVVGWQYMIKLDHLAIDKRNERRSIAPSPRDRQPAKGRRWQGGRRRGGALRTGEMEIWALLASGAHAFLDETLIERSGLSQDGNETLASVKAHLAVGQIGVDSQSGEIRLLDARDTNPVPDEWLASPKTYGHMADRDSDVLYADIHGIRDDVVACAACGNENQDGHRCERCGDIANRRESPERAEVRFHVRLDVPVWHPWFGWRRADEKSARQEPFPKEAAHDRKVRSEQAVKAAWQAEFEATLGWRLDDGLIVALNDEEIWTSNGVEPLPISGTRLDGAVALEVDQDRERVFVLAPDGREGEVAELDLNTGKFVREWIANPRRGADRAELITLSERGWPVLWGPEIGRCDCIPMLHVVPILPPAYRVFARDWIDRRYRDLFRTINLISTGAGDARLLVRAVRGVLGGRYDRPDAQTISGRLNSKMGLLRRGLRGRHNNGVARSVIAPNASLGLEQVGLPAATMAELGLTGDEVVVVNRQPTLRPSNVVALRAYEHDGNHVALHPLMAKQLAGDFDGDEVTLHLPVSKKAADEAWQRLRPTAALLSDANGEPIMKPDLDVALGLHLLSQHSGSRAELIDCLGLDVPEAVTGEQAEDLVSCWYRRMKGQADCATQIHSLFEMAASACVGWSASLLELERMDETQFDGFLDAVNAGPNSGEEGSGSTAGQAAATPPAWLVEALRAGVAGEPGGVRQLLVRRGKLRTLAGDEHSKIEACFLDGLSSDELFETAPAALEKLAQKKLVTPFAGVLTKRLADAMYEVRVTDKSCGSQAKRRTPLDCQADEGCCEACIGELPSGRIPEVGEHIGLRAAMLIGERCTQRAMDTFHSGGTNKAVGGTIEELNAAFGERRQHPGCLSFEDAVNSECLPTIRSRLHEIADRVEDSLKVDHKLVCLVLRHLLDTGIERKPLRCAASTGDPLFDATILGELTVLLDAAGRKATSASGLRASGLQATQVYHYDDATVPDDDDTWHQDQQLHRAEGVST